MNPFQNRKAQELQKPFPGCMGSMINIFDLSSSMGGTKLLTEKAHRDDSPIRRNRPELVKKAVDHVRVQKEDKPVARDLRKVSSKRSGGTPIKTLIAHEMSRDVESKQEPPNLVARLMGLDALPVQQSVLISRSSSRDGYSHNTLVGLQGYRQQEEGLNHKLLHTNSYTHEKECKDVYEVWKQPPATSHMMDQSREKGRFSENPIEKRMALVRQKFIEAKRLATDEKLLQSKEFQDALEVLSSNRDLFLKFLEEPNSLFSKHLQELRATSPLSQTKRITLLKPSKATESMSGRQVKKHVHPAVKDMNKYQKSSIFTHPKSEYISQPTRIVVLKPSPGKSCDLKTVVASTMQSSQLMESGDLHEGLGTNEATESRELAKDVTRKMQESLSSNRVDEALLSSALSNGYVGDESSFNRSEIDYIEEECDNFSDLETMTPTSRHTWDCFDRLGSPYSLSSYSRASYSPESSVIKEAKKRLSERWAMVASNGISQDRIQLRKSSSTLGEMLAIPEVKKEEECDMLTISSSGSCGGEQDLSVSAACLSIAGTKEISGRESSPKMLSRSKSLPISSSAYESIGLKEEASESMSNKSVISKEVVKSKNGKLSFKGKVSSLFFSRSKKPVGEKRIPSSPVVSGKRDDVFSKSLHDHHSEESMILGSKSEGKPGKVACPPSSLTDLPKQVTCSVKDSLSLEKHRIFENQRENQDQPSPVSVLEASFEDDTRIDTNIPQSSSSAVFGCPQALSRSPPIGSIARTLSWEDIHSEASLSNSLKLSKVLSKECEEQIQSAFVLRLLSSASLDDENSSTVLAGWHSLESPLDPTLVDEFLERKEEEAKCRERRSNQRLLFDCVNAALLEVGHASIMAIYPWSRLHSVACKKGQACAPVTEEVGRLVKVWFSGEGNRVSNGTENRNQVLDGMVMREVTGNRWMDPMWFEIDEFSKEIGGKVLEELVEEALADLTGGCFCC